MSGEIALRDGRHLPRLTHGETFLSCRVSALTRRLLPPACAGPSSSPLAASRPASCSPCATTARATSRAALAALSPNLHSSGFLPSGHLKTNLALVRWPAPDPNGPTSAVQTGVFARRDGHRARRLRRREARALLAPQVRRSGDARTLRGDLVQPRRSEPFSIRSVHARLAMTSVLSSRGRQACFARSACEPDPTARSSCRSRTGTPRKTTSHNGRVILLAAACGGSPGSHVAEVGSTTPSSTSSATAPPAQRNGAVAFARCMRWHAVPRFPDPDSSGAIPKVALEHLGVSSSRFQAAQRDCNRLLPNGGPPPSQAQRQRMEAQGLRFSRRVRAHGVSNFPIPAVTAAYPTPAKVGVDQGSPRFEDSNQAVGSTGRRTCPRNSAYNA